MLFSFAFDFPYDDKTFISDTSNRRGVSDESRCEIYKLSLSDVVGFLVFKTFLTLV